MGFVNIFFITFIFINVSRNLILSQELKKDLNHSRCTSDNNCSANAYCHASGICQCKEHYIPDRVPNIPGKRAYHTVCLKEASFIGDHCKKDIQCKTTMGPHSECVISDVKNELGSCHCTKEAHYTSNWCYKTSLIGEICEVNDNCFTKSKNIKAYCDRECICPPMYHATTDKFDCQPSSGLGGPCLDDIGCMVFNSGCRYGFCRCKPEYISGDQNKSCLLLAKNLEDPCEVHDQCSVRLQNTRCDEQKGVCVCENDSHNVDGKCWKTARFLEPCRYHPECLVDKESKHGVTCKEGLCQCGDGFVLKEHSYCLKLNRTETNAGHRVSPKILLYGGFFLIIPVLNYFGILVNFNMLVI